MAKKEKKELDKETLKIVTTGDKLKGMTEHEGWAIAKKLLYKKVADLLSLNDLMDVDAGTIVQLIAAKKRTADTLLAWVREIEGTVAQSEGNKNLVESILSDFIINEEVE